MTPRPPLRLVPGGLGDVEISAPPADHAARSARRVVEAAQRWAALMLDLDLIELLDFSTEGGRAALDLLDSVDEYMHHAKHGNGPATAG